MAFAKPLNTIQPEFQHTDNRRTLSQVITTTISQVNRYEANHNVTLGGHYHKDTTEHFYVIRGTATVILRKGVTESIFRVYPQDFFTVEPETWHQVKTESVFEMLTFLDKPYTQENPDTYVE